MDQNSPEAFLTITGWHLGTGPNLKQNLPGWHWLALAGTGWPWLALAGTGWH